MYKRLATILIMFLAAFSFIVVAATDPQGPSTLRVNWSQRNTPYDPLNLSALAGNITELEIFAKTQTRTWQGYVGNISGTITLDDASNWTLYDWSNTEPRGQIYATPTAVVPTWANINCFEYYVDGTNRYNLTEIESVLGLDPTERDGVNETFKYKNHPLIYVGSKQINADNCWSTNMYQNDVNQTNNFFELLLTDNTTSSIIYTTIIENRTPGALSDVPGYNGVQYDFQMLVGENGHGIDIATTPYWFYVELI
jgi:hypothetical protein